MISAEAHPPTHLLAELVGDALDDGPAGEIQAHVSQCADCQQTVQRLTQVTVALSALPDRLPVPEHVSARLGAALAAEAAAPIALDGGPVAWFRRRVPQVLAAAASVAVIGLAGYVVVDGDGGGDSSGGMTTADAGARSAPETPVSPEALSDGPGSVGSQREFGAAEDQAAPDVDAAALDVWEQRGAFAPGCGQVLADETGEALVGSTAYGSGVLVVLQDGAELHGWLMQTCSSRSNEALETPATLPVPE